MLEVQTDSNHNITLDLNNINNNAFSHIVFLLESKNTNSLFYKLKNEAGMEINFFDKNTNSVGFLFKKMSYDSFVKYIEEVLIKYK